MQDAVQNEVQQLLEIVKKYKNTDHIAGFSREAIAETAAGAIAILLAAHADELMLSKLPPEIQAEIGRVMELMWCIGFNVGAMAQQTQGTD